MDFFNYEKNNDLINYSDFIYPKLVSKIETDNIRLYTSQAYKCINFLLRKDDLVGIEYFFIPIIDSIDNAIEKFKFNSNITVFRYIGFNNICQTEEFLKKLNKGIITDNAFQSCTLKPNLYDRKKQFCFRINVPAFYKGACIKSLSMYKEEEEYLLSRNTSLIIDDVINNDKDTKYLVKARVK